MSLVFSNNILKNCPFRFVWYAYRQQQEHIIKKKSSLPIVFDGDDDAQKYWRMNNCQVARQNYERSIRIKMASSFFKEASSWMCQQIVWSFVEGVADMSTGIKFNSNRSTLKRHFFCYCCCCISLINYKSKWVYVWNDSRKYILIAGRWRCNLMMNFFYNEIDIFYQ